MPAIAYKSLGGSTEGKSTRLDGIMLICLALCTLIMAVSPSEAAQGPEDNLSAFMQLAASDIRAKTTEIISGPMNFTAEERSAFCPIFKKYEYEWGAITD
jgi:hypothetical protein